MKHILYAFACLLSSFLISSCNDGSTKNDDLNSANVPVVVQSAFGAKYPGATDVKWEKATENDKPTYKAKFKSSDKQLKAEFGEDGAFIKDKED